jgi:hypothetical protein
MISKTGEIRTERSKDGSQSLCFPHLSWKPSNDDSIALPVQGSLIGAIFRSIFQAHLQYRSPPDDLWIEAQK